MVSNDTSQGTDGAFEAPTRRWRRPLLVVGLIAVAVVTVSSSGVLDGSVRDQVLRLDALFSGLGVWAPLVFVVVWIAVCLLLLPGLPVSIVGGLIFGAVWGSVWTTIGANLGAAAAFLVARYAARDTVTAWVARNRALARIDAGVERHGWRMLMITRLVPLFPFNLQNYAYGLTGIPFSTYVLVTLPTMIPATVAYNFAAGSAREALLSGGEPAAIRTTLVYLAVAAVAFVVVSLIPGWVSRRFGDAGDDGRLPADG
jgi:uncharacterized membrane protein YdjX (TVP38/TMEM64 family)